MRSLPKQWLIADRPLGKPQKLGFCLGPTVHSEIYSRNLDGWLGATKQSAPAISKGAIAS
ncbi:MAG: hypothetical protein ACRC8Y_02325 [Chroococcales cyanobacterium]